LQLGVQAAFGPSDTAGNSPFFEQAGGGAVALQVRPVDHHGVRRRALPGQGCEDPVEDTNPAPADEAVVERLRRPADGGRVPPHQPAPDHVNDPEITRWSLTRGTPRGLFGRSGFRRANWASDSQKWWSDIANSLHFAGVNHLTGRAEILFMGPKPRATFPSAGRRIRGSFRCLRGATFSTLGGWGEGSHDRLQLRRNEVARLLRPLILDRPSHRVSVPRWKRPAPDRAAGPATRFVAPNGDAGASCPRH
jgi:hypothetical protein